MEFEGTQIPILGADELALFKAMFDRTQDWADIEADGPAGTVRELLTGLVGEDDSRVARLDETCS